MSLTTPEQQGGSTPAEAQTHAEWWNSTEPAPPEAHPPATAYTDAQAAASLRRAGLFVAVLALAGMPFAWVYGGYKSALALAIGAAISGSGLWEWRRLMAALTARMDAADMVQPPDATGKRKAPSIAFAIAGFTVRLLVVLAVLYASLKYLHGSVLALAAGLALGVFSLTVEAIRLLRSGTI